MSHKCDGLFGECKRPVEKCYGQPNNRKTPFENGSYRSGESKTKQVGSAVHEARHLFGGKKK